MVFCMVAGLISPAFNTVAAASTGGTNPSGLTIGVKELTGKDDVLSAFVVSRKLKSSFTNPSKYMLNTGDYSIFAKEPSQRGSFLENAEGKALVVSDAKNIGEYAKIPSAFRLSKETVVPETKLKPLVSIDGSDYVGYNIPFKKLVVGIPTNRVEISKYKLYIRVKKTVEVDGVKVYTVEPTDYKFVIETSDPTDPDETYKKLMTLLDEIKYDAPAEEDPDAVPGQEDVKADNGKQTEAPDDLYTFQLGTLKPYFGLHANETKSGKVSPVCGVSTTDGGNSLSDIYRDILEKNTNMERLLGASTGVQAADAAQLSLQRRLIMSIASSLYVHQTPGNELAMEYNAKFPIYYVGTSMKETSSDAGARVSELNTKIDMLRTNKFIDDTSKIAGRALTHHERLEALYISAFSARNANMDLTKQDWWEQYYGSDLPAIWTPVTLTIDGKVIYCGMQYTDTAVSDALPVNAESFKQLCSALNEWGTYGTTYRTQLSEKTPTTTTFDALQNLKDTYDNFGSKFKVIEFMWTYKENDAQKSLQELYEEANNMNAVGALTNDYELDRGQPLTDFFNVDGLGSNIQSAASGWLNNDNPSGCYLEVSDNIKIGIKESAAYIPMQTNVYSTDLLLSYDENFLRDFHYKYGFMRKALLKDNNASAAQDYYVRGDAPKNLSVCTLKDLVERKEDIVLYVQSNVYNDDALIEDIQNKSVLSAESKMRASDSLLEYANSYVDTPATLEDTDDESDAPAASTALPVKALLSAKNLEDLFSISDIASYGVDVLKDKVVELKKAAEYVATDMLVEKVLKTGKFNQYSDMHRALILALNGHYIEGAVKGNFFRDNVDNVVLSSAEIDDVLDCTTTRSEYASEEDTTGYEYKTYDEYTPDLAYAFTSAVYRDSDVYAVLSEANSTPVFIASSTLIDVEDASIKMKNSIFNYALMRNLKSQTQLNYAYCMDMNAPLYMDIYGNILTESGYVVVPAASNATLFNHTYNENPISMGLYAVYGGDYRLPKFSSETSATILSGSMILDDDLNVYTINKRSDTNSSGDTIQWNSLDSYSPEVTQVAKDACGEFISNKDNVNWVAMSNIISEVMRGAPIEYVNKQEEKLISQKSTVGLRAAAKLERLIESLKSSNMNSILAIPNFSTLEHYNIVVAFLFKMLLVASSVIIIIAIYRDGSSGQLNFNTFLKTLFAIVLTALSVATIPSVFQFTYYGANKFLLQKEARSIVLYSTEKYESGVEVEITSSEPPERSDEILVQLDWLDVPWYRHLDLLLMGSSTEAVKKARAEALLESDVADQPDVRVLNDGVYLSVQDIFDSVGMDYTFAKDEDSVRELYLYSDASDVKTLSFYTPYYVFLKALTYNVNSYNYTNNVYKYNTKYMSGSRLKTVGLSETYFKSNYFMEDSMDILHLYEITGVKSDYSEYDSRLFSEVDIARMKTSLWYTNPLDEEGTEKRVKLMNDYARDYIAENKDLLNKVSDETFIKSMALDMALHYNKLWGVSAANSYELFNLDSNELVRLSIAPRDKAMIASPMSFANYVNEFGGEAGVYAAALLTMVLWVGSFVKPACVVIAYLAVFLSLFVFKVCLHKKENTIQGYVITVALLCATNLLHAVMLKAGMLLPELGLPVLPCLLFLTFGQVVYLVFLVYVTGISLRDWKDLGEYTYKEKLHKIKSKFNPNQSADMLSGKLKHHTDNWQYYVDLQKQHRERNTL